MEELSPRSVVNSVAALEKVQEESSERLFKLEEIRERLEHEIEDVSEISGQFFLFWKWVCSSRWAKDIAPSVISVLLFGLQSGGG